MGLPRSCIVGAGPSGFTTAKALKDRGLPFDCYEMSGVVGGNWAYDNSSGRSACYRSLHTDSSKQRMQFADFPMPADYPDYPHHAQIAAYFKAYVAHFGLEDDIVLNTKVKRAVRGDDALWHVALSSGETRTYDALFVCNGHHWDPHIPEIPGTFEGTQFHTQTYRSPLEPCDLREARVLVVGLGNSALDIASELSGKGGAREVLVSARRGVWIVPRHIAGHTPDAGLAPKWMPAWLARRAADKAIISAVGQMRDYGLPQPTYHPTAAQPAVSDDFLARLREGRITVVGNVREKRGRNVVFENGRSEEIDAIIYATGYNLSFPFLDDTLIKVENNHVPLFKRVFKPGVDNLFFMGLAQTLPLANLAEHQARWIAAYLCGEYLPPSEAEMEKTIVADEARETGRDSGLRQHRMQVDYERYCRDVKTEWKRGKARAEAKGFGPNRLPLPARARCEPTLSPARATAR